MLRKVIFVCCGTLLACAAAGTAWATTYSFVQLAPLGADLRDYAFGVNAVGGVPEVVGKSGPILGTAYYQGTPAIWNSAGVGTSILADIPSSPFAAVSATATGVDSSGNVVGVGSSTTSSTTSMKDAFYLAAGGSLATVLPNLTANTTTPYAYSMATGINAGIIVGESVYTDGNTHAVVWTQTGGTWGVTDLDPNVTSNSNFAYAVNSGGVVVGTSIVNSKQDPVTWTYSGGSWTLNDLINRGSLVNAAEALAINDNGVAVGWKLVGHRPQQHPTCRDVFRRERRQPGRPGFQQSDDRSGAGRQRQRSDCGRVRNRQRHLPRLRLRPWRQQHDAGHEHGVRLQRLQYHTLGLDAHRRLWYRQRRRHRRLCQQRHLQPRVPHRGLGAGAVYAIAGRDWARGPAGLRLEKTPVAPTPAPAWDRAKIVDAFLAANCKSPGGNGEGR